MIRELIDTELESVAGGLDLSSPSSPYVTLNNVGNVQLNLQPQIAVVGFAGGNAVAQNFGGLLANL
jgi:hypothetical protein